MSSRSSLKKRHNPALDGLRALSAMLIVASHCGVLGQGGVGNVIFFCLAGFLAAQPHLDAPEESFASRAGILSFFKSRILRIIPAYWITIIVVKIATGDMFFSLETMIQNLCFTNVFLHLWFLQQQVLMYLFLPLIMLVLHGIRRSSREHADWACVATLAIIAFACHRFLSEPLPFLNRGDSRAAFLIWIFIIGLAYGYLVRGIRGRVGKPLPDTMIASLAIMVLLALPIVSSHEVLRLFDPSLDGVLVGWQYPLHCSLLAGLLISLLYLFPDCLASRIVGAPVLCDIGAISYEIYLVHPFLLGFPPFEGGLRLFVSILILSCALAFSLHSLSTRIVAAVRKAD